MASQNKETQSEIAQWLGVPSKWINKFTIATTFFIVWMVFFDQHNIFARMRLQGMLENLEIEKVNYEKQIEQAIIDKKDLDNDKEKFAREKHLMHRDDEEVILIETKNKN
jgi:cell division protein DivIC